MTTKSNLNESEMQRVLRRLRKVLALANSSNPGEAAAALQQAKTIMDRYGIDAVDAEATAVTEATVSSSRAEVPVWESILLSVVRNSLGVQVVRETYHKRAGYRRPRAGITFIGEGPKAQIAAYAFDVLRKKLAKSMKESTQELIAKAMPGACPPGTTYRLTAKQRNAYAYGWCASVHNKVSQLAPTPSPAVERYMQQRFADAKAAKKRPDINERPDPLADYMLRQGIRDGGQVALHQAMNASQSGAPSLGHSAHSGA